MKPPADWRTISDQQLLIHCRWETFRGPGPGGQKRNKTSSAVRITHLPTALSAIAMESRSQHQNRARAFARLRHRLALELRHPIDLSTFVLPAQLAHLTTAPDLLAISLRDENYLPLMGLVVDLLAATHGRLSDTAQLLKTTTANLVRFLERDHQLWAKVNQMRHATGLKPLNPSHD
ncbi:MAG TPA: peptide chain release factor-like protein [Tepidisphaeraceae bacterium]|nr:peptide chain release factor-like protein [Tepidisphaeraceae bacterium]